MKRKISMFIVLILSLQMLATSAFAADVQESYNVSAEIQKEMAFAEDTLGGPCSLESVETKVVGNYVVEDRLYVLDTMSANSDTGNVGCISSHVWRPRGSSAWTIKICLYASFHYDKNGVATCNKEEAYAWGGDPSNNPINRSINADIYHTNGNFLSSTASTRCNYAMFFGGDPAIVGTLRIECSNTGRCTYVSEELHDF